MGDDKALTTFFATITLFSIGGYPTFYQILRFTYRTLMANAKFDTRRSVLVYIQLFLLILMH